MTFAFYSGGSTRFTGLRGYLMIAGILGRCARLDEVVMKRTDRDAGSPPRTELLSEDKESAFESKLLLVAHLQRVYWDIAAKVRAQVQG
jgi:hypothetical protein